MSERPKLASVIRERSSEILASWIVRFERSPLRFRRATKAADHAAQVASLVESLALAAAGGARELQPGADATRELERASAFLGARFASEGATGRTRCSTRLDDDIESFAIADLKQQLAKIVTGRVDDLSRPEGRRSR